MKSNKKLIIFAVIIGLGTVYIFNHYLLQNYAEPVQASVEQASVVVAQMTIPQHTRITEEMVGMESVPVNAVHPEALLRRENVVGGISRSEIVRGEQVLTSRVATEDMRASLSYRVPENYRAIAIPVGEVAGVAGYISPGDRVDVLISYPIFKEAGEVVSSTVTTYTTLQNVLVLATGEFTHAFDDEERHIAGTATLLVTPAQAEVLAYAYLQGSFHLTLRSPLDEESVDLTYYNTENFETFRER